MPRAKDLRGQRFGRWLVIEKAAPFKRKDGKKETQYLCKCDCGTIKVRKTKDILHGNSKSCGCYNSENMRNRRKTHGMTESRIYHIWDGMKERCKINTENHKHWAGKGIKICDEWLGEKGFENFFKWSMDNGYSDNLTIDRIDGDGDYEPNNCRWVTYEVQNNNSSKNVKIECFGETKTIAQWAKEFGINYKTLYSRIKKGWTMERALLTTPQGGGR